MSCLAVVTETKGRDRIPVSLSVPVNAVVADLAREAAIFCSALTKEGRDRRLSRVLQRRSGVQDDGMGFLQRSRVVLFGQTAGGGAGAWDSNKAE